MKEQADRVRRSIQEAQISSPHSGIRRASAGYSGDSAAIRRRDQQQKQTAYTHPDEADAPPEDDYGYFGDPAYEHPLAYDDRRSPRADFIMTAIRRIPAIRAR
ncbi:MAG: hypothetical protein ACLUHE_16270 [Christensenellales bacterium]